MKRWITVIAAAIAGHAAAASFTATAPITLGGKDALHRLELPFETYRDARPDLGDVRVLDGAGEEVPFAFAPVPDSSKAAVAATPLPLFPISKVVTEAQPGSEVTIRTADGALVSVRGAAKPPAAAKPAAWLADASAMKEPIAALVFEWDAGAGQEVTEVHVAGSDDLKSWTALGDVPLVHVEQDGRILSQPRMEFAPRKVKYLRITWDGPALGLRAVKAEPQAKSVRAPRHASRVGGTAGAPGEWIYDLGARLPVEAVRILPAQANDVIAATLSIRNDEREAWRPVARGSFYRLDRSGVESQSPPLEIGPTAARYWRVQAPSPRSAAPQLEVTWPGRQIVFAARGEGPFTLAFGDPELRSAALPLDTLMPGYEKDAEAKLPLAKAAEVRKGAPPSRWERLVQAPPKRLALWAVLIAGVGLLGFLAWRLAKGG